MTNLAWQNYRYLFAILVVGPVIGLAIGSLAGLVLYIFFRFIPTIDISYEMIFLWGFVWVIIGTFTSIRECIKYFIFLLKT